MLIFNGWMIYLWFQSPNAAPLQGTLLLQYSLIIVWFLWAKGSSKQYFCYRWALPPTFLWLDLMHSYERSFICQRKIDVIYTITRKNQLSRIFAKIQPQNYRFSGISNPQRFLRYLFSFPRYWDNIGFNIFFNSAHIWIF